MISFRPLFIYPIVLPAFYKQLYQETKNKKDILIARDIINKMGGY